jgi:hypothetical protein
MAHANHFPEATRYFNLHTVGIGYLNRVREVQVAGGEAERLIRFYSEAVNAENKVLLAFRIGDLWIDPFLYEKGVKEGQPGASLKGRLLFIDWIKVNGLYEYKAPARQPATTTAEQAPVPEPSSLTADTAVMETETRAASVVESEPATTSGAAHA